MKFAVDERITFAEEPDYVYTVRAINDRYAVLTRPMTLMDVEEHEQGTMGKDVIYTIVDSETWMRGPHNLVRSHFDFYTPEGCEKCLEALMEGAVGLSNHRSVPVLVVEPVTAIAGTERATSELSHGTYLGPVESLKGKDALVSKNEAGSWIAQFDDVDTGKGYGWWAMPDAEWNFT